MSKPRGLRHGYTFWTPKQDALLLEMFPSAHSVASLIKILGHPEDSIRNRARRFGLKRGTRTPGDRLGGLAEDTQRAIDLAARPGGVSAAELSIDTSPRIARLDGASSFLCKMVRAGKLFRGRARVGARYFTTKEAAQRHATPLAMKPWSKPKARGCRPGWGPDDPAHFTPATVFTYAPPPPAMVFRTGTHSPL
jgi:hypothetical protein